jgi:hypothetical protein
MPIKITALASKSQPCRASCPRRSRQCNVLANSRLGRGALPGGQRVGGPAPIRQPKAARSRKVDAMKLPTRARRAVFAALAAAVAVNLAATTAPASSTTLNAQVTGGGAYTGSAHSVSVEPHGFTVTCSASGSTPALTASGSVPNGTKQGASPLKIGTAKTLSASNCTGPLGAVTMTFSKLPYPIKIDSVTNGSGQTDTIISGISAELLMTGCTFTVTGAMPGYYTNGTGELNLTPDLPTAPLNKAQSTISDVSGCAGLVHKGQKCPIILIIILIIVFVCIAKEAKGPSGHETLAGALRITRHLLRPQNAPARRDPHGHQRSSQAT